MILSKTILHTRSNFLTSLRNYKIQSCNLHVLCVRHPRLRAGTKAALINQVNQIATRFESSQASVQDKNMNASSQESNTSIVDTTEFTNDNLPELPVVESTAPDIPELIAENITPILELNKLGEPTLQSIGLGSYWTPTGWVQHLLEWVHVSLGLPWWASIVVCVAVMRLLLFPLVIHSQRTSIKMHNVMPQMQDIQLRMQNARTYGNNIESMKTALELHAFMKENNVSPLKSLIMPAVQAPIFISYFTALRAMANTPVESMSQGGLWWFTDLTVSDPFYIVPLVTCGTLFITLQVGVDFARMPSASAISRNFPIFVKGVPVVVFPFIMHFPSAVSVYWATTNIVSLVQVLFLRVPAVRKYFCIDQKIKHAPEKSPIAKQGLVKGIKSSWGNMRIAREIQEREQLDEMSFRRAGRAPPAKTYKTNPLLKKEAVQAKRN